MINLCVTAGRSQVGRRREEQGYKVSLVCYIGSVAMMMITIIKGMVQHAGYFDSAARNSDSFSGSTYINTPLFLICVLHVHGIVKQENPINIQDVRGI